MSSCPNSISQAEEKPSGTFIHPRRYSDLYLKFNTEAAVLRSNPPPGLLICTTDAHDAVREEG